MHGDPQSNFCQFVTGGNGLVIPHNLEAWGRNAFHQIRGGVIAVFDT